MADSVRGRTLFITSERATGEPRRYTVRAFNWVTGKIEDVTGFMELASLADAKELMARLVPLPNGGAVPTRPL